MSSDKKQKIDLCDNVINQIDIASEILLLENSENENVKNKINQMREEMVVKLKEIEHLNLSNIEQKYAYFVQVQRPIKTKKKRSENLLGYLIILNQDLSHLFNNLQ